MNTSTGVKLSEKEMHEIVNTSTDPELTKLALAQLYHSVKFGDKGESDLTYVQLAEKLGIDRKEAMDTLGHLAAQGVLQREFESGHLVVPSLSLSYYINGDLIYGGKTRFFKEHLSPTQVTAAMDAVTDLVEFRYIKQFAIPHTTLKEIRERVHSKVEAILKDQERAYIAAGVPPAFSDFPSFVKKESPRFMGSDTTGSFHAPGNFSTPQAAIAAEIDRGAGKIVVSRDYEIDPVIIVDRIAHHERPNQYQVCLINMQQDSRVQDRPYDFMKKVIGWSDTLQGNLEAALS